MGDHDGVDEVITMRGMRITRIGAVLSLVERFRESGDGDAFAVQVEPSAFVVHNPHCPCPISTTLWGELPQLIVDGDVLRWSDDKPILSY
jgi:hypothetical protein